MARYAGVLLDLGGVVFTGDAAIAGSVEAVARLREAGVAVRFLTNTTRKPRRALVARLTRLGIAAEPDAIFTPAFAARHVLAGRVPHLLVHPDLVEDFADHDEAGGADVVLVGDAGEAFTYAALNAALRALENGAALFALAKNRVFQDGDGRPSLDAGPFVAALEYASGQEAEVIGKPAQAFFDAACASLGTQRAETVMIGDDVEGDVGGALDAGLAGVLVRTGKFKPGDEGRIDPGPTAVQPDLAAAVAWILEDHPDR